MKLPERPDVLDLPEERDVKTFVAKTSEMAALIEDMLMEERTQLLEHILSQNTGDQMEQVRHTVLYLDRFGSTFREKLSAYYVKRRDSE